MPNEKISDYDDEAGELQPTDLHDISVDKGGGSFNSEQATHYLVTGGEKISKVFGDFSVASTQEDIVVFTLKAGRKLVDFVIKHEDAWTGGSISLVTVVLGIVGNESKYLPFDPFDIFQSPGELIIADEEPTTIESMDNDVDIVMRITSVGDNLDQLSAGSIDLFIFTKSMKP